MNKMIAGLFAAALVAAPAFADVGAPAPTAKDLEKAVEQVNYVETAKSGVKLSGYVDAGYIYNFTGGDSVINGRQAVDAQPKGDFNLNAVKLTLEKPLSSANELQAGFRADLKFGEDANILNGDGIDGSSDTLSVDQAYVIIRAPWGNGLDITVGKFASLLGYEVDDRPANLNITYGYDYTFVTTHQTGVKLYYPINDILEAQFAVSNGSGLDTNDTQAAGSLLDTAEDAYAINATLNVKAPGGNANWFNGFYASTGAADTFTSENEGVYIWNTWGNWAPKFANDKLLLGFSNTLGAADSESIGTVNSQTFWTASLYAKYQFTDIFSLAGRASYFHSSDDDNVTVGSFETSARESIGSNDLWSWTATAGFDLLENLMLRAEYRVDFGNDITGNTNDGASDSAHTLAFQAVYTF